MTLYVKKSNSSNETPNVMTVGVEKYGLMLAGKDWKDFQSCLYFNPDLGNIIHFLI
jgi:hypothetical protein